MTSPFNSYQKLKLAKRQVVSELRLEKNKVENLKKQVDWFLDEIENIARIGDDDLSQENDYENLIEIKRQLKNLPSKFLDFMVRQ